GGGKPTLDDLLELNGVFRYKKPRFEGHESVARNLLPHASVDALFCSETTAVEDVGGSERRPLLYDYWEFLLRKPLRLGADEYYSLLSGEWDEWDVYADKRAFVWTCAVMDGGGGALRERFFAPSSDKWEAHNYGHWVKLLNVDYSAGETSRHAATDFEREWARERTYHRWEQRGTFYGFSYHSGAALMPAETDPPVWRHWGT